MTTGTLRRLGPHDDAIGERPLGPTVGSEAGARESSTGRLGEPSWCDGVVPSCAGSRGHGEALAELASSAGYALGEVSPGRPGPRS
jgi:hypothetical protein